MKIKHINKFIIVTLLILCSAMTVFAGTTHEEYGRVNNAADGTTAAGCSFNVYYVPRPTEISKGFVGTLITGFWYKNVGSDLVTQWNVGDDHLVYAEKTVNAGTINQKNYYAVTNINVTGASPDLFPPMTLREVPSPNAVFSVDHMTVTWSVPVEDPGSPLTTNIIGYKLYRSTDPLTGFALVTNNTIPTTNYADYTVVTGNTYYYSLGLVFRAGVSLNAKSAGSAPAFASPTSVNSQTIQIARDTISSVSSKENIILSWDGGGYADIYALTNTYNETFASAGAVTLAVRVLSPWTDTSASGSTVNERYYRVVNTTSGPDSHQVTVGKYDYIVGQGSVKTISFPICPSTTNAEIIFGTQLTPANNNTNADWITTGVGGTAKTYYRGFSGNWWLNNQASTLTLNCVSGYDIGVQPGNPTIDVTIVGVVATNNVDIPLYNGLNIVARIYPTPIALNSANLGTGLTSAGNATDADKVTSDDGNAWLLNGGIWYTGNDPTNMILQPGKAYKISVQGAATTWNQVLR